MIFSIVMSGDIGLIQDDGEEHIITVDGFGTNIRFVPDSLTINEGDTVRFLWSGQLLPHNAIEVNELFNSGDAMRNVDYTYKFNYNQSGVYDFYCEPHRDLGMYGEINVLDMEQSNVSSSDDFENKGGDVGGENNTKFNLIILLIIGFIMFILVYYRTKIDYVEKI